jgi:hypothetical protein
MAICIAALVGTVGSAQADDAPADAPVAGQHLAEADSTESVLERGESPPAADSGRQSTEDVAPAAYLAWNVADEAGRAVPGSTFRLETWRTDHWDDVTDVVDAAASRDGSIDRDFTAGRFRIPEVDVKASTHSDPSGRISSSGRYRIQINAAPEGHRWVSSGDWIDSATKQWSQSGSDATMDFGTFTVQMTGGASQSDTIVQEDRPDNSADADASDENSAGKSGDGADAENAQRTEAPRVIQKAASIPQCVAGYVYGIHDNGQIVQANGSTVTTFGNPVGGTGSKDFNGLGIGTGGGPVFAYNRSGDGSNARPMIYSFDTADGTWSSKQRVPEKETDGVTFIAGAVSLDNSRYYLGGYAGSDNGREFRLWEYVPGGSSVVYKGKVAAPGSGSANGDIAFDRNGNLFIVRGSGSTTTVYSVTKANLDAASGGTIPSAAANTVNDTTNNVNGVAFDSTGKGFLGGSNVLESHSMPGWTGRQTVTSSLGGSTDLASCGSPPTITIEKVIEGGRAKAGDQFKLTLKQGDTEISQATTSGSQTGLQNDRIGPLPTVRGIPLSFSESAAGTTSMGDYASSYQCRVDGGQQTQGNGTSGSITIPADGQSVVCTFHNAPLTAKVRIHKDIKSGTGVIAPGQGWTVGARTQSTAGTVSADPTASTQTTNAQGNADWTLRFGAVNARATVSVSESQKAGHLFEAGSCAVRHLDGTTTTTALTGIDPTGLTGVKPGDDVLCTYTNKTVTMLTVKKIVKNDYAQPAAPDDFKLTATPKGGEAKAFVSGVSQTVSPGVYVIGETILPGYAQDGIVCMDGAATVETQVMNGSATVTVPDGKSIVCTITNSGKPGSASWQKVDDAAAGSHLSGSEWTLTGPGVPNGTVITDCTGVACGTGKYDDRDPRPGYFRLEDQNWGDYTVTESKAPAGYERSDTEHRYAISAGDLDHVFSVAFVNRQKQPPVLPLTGGMSTDAFLVAGSLLVMVAVYAGFMLRHRKVINR